MQMFGMDDIFAFAGADVAYVVLVVALDVVMLYLARTFFKKI